MRSKVDGVDYKYFIDPNIPPFKIEDSLVEEIRKTIPALQFERINKYINEYGISKYDATVLVKDKEMSDYFDKLISLNIDPKIASNWLTTVIAGYLNKNDLSISDLYLTSDMLAYVINSMNKGDISSKQAKEVFAKAIEEKKEPKNYISKENAQNSDETELTNIIVGILDASGEQIEQYKAGKKNLFDYFVGQVMKNTRGKANPVMTKEIIQRELDKR